MVLGDIGEAGIAQRIACPVQQWDVHHGIDDHPAGAVAVPRADELTTGVITAGQQMGRMQAARLAALVARQTIVGDGRKQPHEPDVVVKARVAVECPIELVLDLARGLQELLVLRSAVALPQDAGPEAVGPPDQVLGGGGHILLIGAVLGDIGDLTDDAIALGTKALDQLRECVINPTRVLITHLICKLQHQWHLPVALLQHQGRVLHARASYGPSDHPRRRDMRMKAGIPNVPASSGPAFAQVPINDFRELSDTCPFRT